MTESDPQFPVSPENILAKLKASELKSIEVKVEDLSWLNTVDPMSDEELTTTVFKNNKRAAESFFKRRAQLQIDVFSDPNNENNVYIITSRDNPFITILQSRKRDLWGQIVINGDNLFISNPSLKRAIEIKSLLPPANKSVLFGMQAFVSEVDENGQERSGFGYAEDSNTFLFDKITDLEGVTSSCHELGHIWAKYVEIDKQNEDSRRAREHGYQITKDVDERGWDKVKKGVSEVLFSERIANIIAKIIAQKIEKTSPEEYAGIFSREWRNTQEAAYDKHYLTSILEKAPELSEGVKSHFISRLNRTNNG
jgi:outer membrane lipoprotein-sorting protein